MVTIETNVETKIQKRRAKFLERHSHEHGSAVIPVIRTLPVEYPVMRNFSVNESVFQPLERGRNFDIYIKVNSVFKRIKTRDIYLIEGLCDYINIYTDEKRFTTHATLYGILEKLPGADFMRVHRSYIVRIDRISSIESNMLSVETRTIPVSKTYKGALMSKLNIINA